LKHTHATSTFARIDLLEIVVDRLQNSNLLVNVVAVRVEVTVAGQVERTAEMVVGRAETRTPQRPVPTVGRLDARERHAGEETVYTEPMGLKSCKRISIFLL